LRDIIFDFSNNQTNFLVRFQIIDA